MTTVPYAAVQQAASVTAASITGVTAATAAAFMTIDKQRKMLSLVSTLDQSVVVLKNGVYWHILPPASSTSYPGAVFDVGSDDQLVAVGDSFTAYATSATPTSGALWGMAT